MPHALIIDDDSDLSASLAALVTEEGFTVAIAASLAEAREHMRTPPDIILLDLVLPDGNGIDLLRDLGAGDATEIVVVTGHGSIETSIEAIRRGASDYLLKPINGGHLRS